MVSASMTFCEYLHVFFMKSRHKILIPMLIIHLTKNKTIKKKGYKGSFYRNIHERTDSPVFSIEDALGQITSNLNFDDKNHKNEEKFDLEMLVLHFRRERSR